MPTLTITFTTQQATRAATAVGDTLGLVDEFGVGRAATLEECRLYSIDCWRRLVKEREDVAAAKARVVLPFDPT